MSTNYLQMDMSLDREEKELARDHWLKLMFAPSVRELELARQSLCNAAPRIQSCIMAAFIEWTREEKELTPEETPFDMD